MVCTPNVIAEGKVILWWNNYQQLNHYNELKDECKKIPSASLYDSTYNCLVVTVSVRYCKLSCSKVVG